MHTGEVFTNVANMAIPFGLLFALKTMKRKDALAKELKSIIKPKGKVPAKKVKGGSCSLCNNTHQSGGRKEELRDEILQITNDLRTLLSL